MPRLPKDQSEQYHAGIAEWTPKVLSTIQELAATSDNKVKRSDILAEMGEGYEARFTLPIFKALLASGEIAATGAARGRGARWGVANTDAEDISVDVATDTMQPEAPASTLEEIAVALMLATEENTAPEIKVAGSRADTAIQVINGQKKAVMAVLTDDAEAADYVANTGDKREIKRWLTRFLKNMDSVEA